MARKKELTEVRVFLPPSVIEWVDQMVAEAELGRTRSSVIRALLVDQKREVEKYGRI